MKEGRTEVPLQTSEHLENADDEGAPDEGGSVYGDVQHPDESDEDVGDLFEGSDQRTLEQRWVDNHSR